MEVFTTVTPIQSIQGVLTITAVQNWEMDSIDVKQAYLNLTIHHDVYLKPPIGIKIPPRKALKVVKGLYSLKQSGCEWNIELDSHLQTIGFHCMPSTPCLYSRGTGNRITIITAYVDDMLITLPSHNKVDHTKQEIMDKWEMEDNGKVKEFLGIKITHYRGQRRISLDLTAYVKAMVSKWLGGTNEKSWIPMLSVARVAGGKKCNPQQVKQYQELVGQLFAWKAATHMVKYLNQTSGYQLHLGGGSGELANKPVTTYTNTNWASDPTNGWRSTSGAIMYVYGCPVSWKSHIQKCVALSVVEAEFIAASKAVQEVLFFSYLLWDLEFTDVQPTLYTDSQECIQGLNTSQLARMIGLEILPRGGVEDVSASQEECTSYSWDTKGPNACISNEHNKAHEGCHTNGSGASQKAATQGVTKEVTHLAQT
ncbi:uncharacterized protein UHO2_00433 [Ustilago hordei]|uniref:uncharacterized protein n=1 Tax=Ustilago hordei TaxID=120017 RepID=UPI001A538527|nr:uncharacterized protein UHO2_00433 [Ustilago hordei]SYW81948.1 uncharacterized protein UHO2_00433 [Ustilago hordei]